MTFYEKKESKYGKNGSCTIFHPTFRPTNIILPSELYAFGHKMRPPIFTCSTDKNREKNAISREVTSFKLETAIESSFLRSHRAALSHRSKRK